MVKASLVDIQHVGKSYGGVQALRDVSLSIAPGEVHALCGENGAGKSTLIKIITGSVVPDTGQVMVDGVPLKLGDVREAEDMGIGVIHQESSAFLHLNAEDNIFVGREPKILGGMFLNRREMRLQTRALLDRLGEPIDQRRELLEMTVAQRQMVSIARALSRKVKLLIMDEPTASLSARETEVLFRIIRQLRSEGVSMLYVSHRMEEVFDLSDRVTVFRDGRWVATEPTKSMTTQSLIQKMVGREIGELGRRHDTGIVPGPVVLETQNLSRGRAFQDISFTVRAGEIVGLAGLVGAGRSEVAQAIFGVDDYDSGEVRVNGNPIRKHSIKESMAAGIALVPEDRQHLGLVLPMSVGANLTMAVLKSLTRGGFISGRLQFELSEDLMRGLMIKAASTSIATETLSGGNQQKVMLGKWLAPNPKVLLLDEPTRGIDVGAKAEVHKLVRELAGKGMATLLISSELPELLSLSDRIVVMRQGRISGELQGPDATQEKLLELALPKT
ncbi:MAG TPA: sugar ABC transporter ATP-binding protein [Tepidisphaeraceae bacterium]|nr:sugar ABC transporter ATP-binding protein [Tepidisphaeraceae bacterium]